MSLKNYLNQGYNCCESLLRTLRDEGYFIISDDVLKISQVFNGAGKARKQCGYVNGGLMAIGLKYGRTTSNVSREPAQTKAREFALEFEKEFGSVVCEKLRPEGFDCNEDEKVRATQRCREIGEGALWIVKKYLT